MAREGLRKLLRFIIASFFVSSFIYILSQFNVYAATGIHKQINFQGKVVNTNGTNVTNGSYNFLFCLYTTASPSTACTAGANNDAVWRESKSLTVTDGVFRTSLGDTTALPGSVDFNTDNIYLGVNFNSDGQMTPLIRFTAVPYAFNALKVAGLTVTDTTGTFTLAAAKILTVNNTLTFSGTDSTTITFQGTDTYVGRATTDTLTNKTIGSTGLIFSGATTDITTTSGEALVVTPNGAAALTLGTTGAGNTTSITLATDSTGDAEVVLPTGSISSGEILDATIAPGDLDTQGTETDEWCLTRETTSGAPFEWQSCGAGGSSLQAAYESGNTISINSTEGALGFDLVSANFDIEVGQGTDTGDFRIWDGTVNWLFIDESADTLALGAAAGSGITIGGTGITTTNSGLLAVNGNTTLGDSNTVDTFTGNLLTTSITSGATTQDAFSLTSSSQTTGQIIDVTGTFNPGGTATNFVEVSVTNANDTAAITLNGFKYEYTNNPGVAANLERAFTIQNQATTNTTDNNVTALLWLDNADTSGTGSTVIQNAIHIQNSGNISGGIVNAIHIEDTDVTTDLKLQNGETIDNDVDGTIALTATTVSLSGSLSIGSNSIVTSGATISQAELDRLDGKDAALVDQNDLTSGDGAGGTSSGSGLEAGTGGIGLLQGCADNQILKWNEASSVWECASDRSTVAIVKSADESVANSTMQDDNELLFAVGTSETWAIDSNLVYTTGGSSSPDIKVAVNGPASSTCVYGVMSHAVATATNQNFGEISTCDTAVALATTATGERQVFIKGSVVTAGSTGNIAIRWAQNTSNATATVVETGSYLLGFKVSGADLAEVYYAKEGEDVSPGTVVSLDQSREAGVIKSQKPYDSNVLGIVSTRPGLVLGEGNRAGVPVFVALSGRVPIKVSGENGAIRPGDYLTASSIPGVAMKATRAGPIVGQALTSHVENGEGEVITFIKNGYFNGSLAAIPIPFESGEEVQTRGDPALGILSYFLNQRGDGPPGGAPIDMSEVVTDRLVAGLEVITPKLVAETAVLDKIQPATGEDVSLNLGANGRFVVKDGEEKEGVVFDSQGNAYIPGLLIANKIKANQIEGLEIFTNKLAKLEESEQKISTSEAGLVLGENTGNSSLDLEVTGQLISKGGLIVENKATFKEETVFEKLVTLLSNVIFRGEVSFEKVPTFSKDTAGFARIKRGERFVFVEFEKEYVNEPVVNATLYMPKFDQQAFEEKVVNGDCVLPTAATECQDRILSSILSDDIKYVITEKTSKGFVILLSKFAPQDISFAWSAIAVREPRTSDRNSLIDSRIFNIQTDSKSQEEPNLESSLPETSPTPALESTATSEAELN